MVINHSWHHKRAWRYSQSVEKSDLIQMIHTFTAVDNVAINWIRITNLQTLRLAVVFGCSVKLQMSPSKRKVWKLLKVLWAFVMSSEIGGELFRALLACPTILFSLCLFSYGKKTSSIGLPSMVSMVDIATSCVSIGIRFPSSDMTQLSSGGSATEPAIWNNFRR